MLSIVIVSINKSYLNSLTENIQQTIGTVPYELLVIDNTQNKKGICERYNQAAKQAKYEIICYVHEDIEFMTDDWGGIITDIFKDHPEIGLLGFAGASYKSMSPSGWFCYGGLESIHHNNVVQHYKFSDKETRHTYVNKKKVKLTNVAVLDGVYLCTKKSIVLQYPFDDQLLKGFHCYDVDISLSIGQHYDVAVTFDVLINHFSEGNYGSEWIKETIKLQKKWQHLLPLNKANLNKKEIRICEKKAMRYFLFKLSQLDFPLKERLSVLWHSQLYKIVGWPLFLKLHKDLIWPREHKE
ncbi:hypothetical protein H8S90_12945 [Olivibacter sp. SDN3]|uniref:glycosyltransferase n=1 Tax=Olivibacter sp. SDN3 TaxID=2764720 RepID=UPI001650F6B1|nr:glycosyltransferase [Olivibacter sp. SDN3]QNL47732.1 hypothetical protein H8S90_12945 [Olivibacter sp. SDN3]